MFTSISFNFSPSLIRGHSMLQKILLLAFILLYEEGEGKVLPDESEFTKRLCATVQRPINLIGSSITTVTCRNAGYGTANDSLPDTQHWCLQDHLKITKDSRTFFVPSGCSLWVKETEDMPVAEIDVSDKTGLTKLGQERKNVTGGIVETKECQEEGLNSSGNNLRGTEHWCRQQMINLNFVGDDPVPSGCTCYVR